MTDDTVATNPPQPRPYQRVADKGKSILNQVEDIGKAVERVRAALTELKEDFKERM